MVKKVRYPDFVVGGAPKSGTSSLYFWLSEHPQICGSRVKETFFFADEVNRFNTNRNFITHGLEAYSHFFKDCGDDVKAFEATAHYLYYNTAREELNRLPGKTKMIFILREPVAQIYSHYKMVKYRIKTFNGSFEEYLATPSATFQVEYAHYLRSWLETFGKDRVKVLIFEELMKNKQAVLKEVCNYLGVNDSFYEAFDFQHRNESVAIKSGWLHKTGLKLQPLIPHRIQKTLLPLYMKLNSGALKTSEQQDDTELKESLVPLAKRVKAELTELMPELNLSYWN
jgi:hypothetical protein